MASTAGMAKQQQHFNVTINGLRKLLDDPASEPTQREVELNSLAADAPLHEIWTRLEELGYASPFELCSHGSARYRWHRSDTKTITYPYREVTVVGPKERSDYNRNIININDTLISFANQPYEEQSQLQFKLQPESLGGRVTGAQKLVVNESLELIFHRTLRMPDDNRLHQLPASLGIFPLFNVEEYASRLPPTIEDQGGIFFPMWQREAMWIGFNIKNKYDAPKYAIRIFVGRINAITGLPMDQANKKDETGEFKQDYIVVPEQPWIDGICVTAGVVRQFVAMPLGSGYSVEAQITGEEKFGGLQLEVIPGYRRNLKQWAPAPKPGGLEPAYSPLLGTLDESRTPADLGLELSDKLRAYPVPSTATVPLNISDIAEKFSSDKICLTTMIPTLILSPANQSTSRHRHSLRRKAHYPSALLPASPTLQKWNPGPLEPLPIMTEEMSSPIPLSKTLATNKLSFESVPRSISTLKSKSAIIQVKTSNLRAMGLAAGGKMIQDIIRDENAAATWNLQKAKLMNVHILDPAGCEQVTHIVPAPPPMDAQTYTDANLPFFVVEEDADNRLDEGDFGQVVSVSGMDKKVGVATEPELDPKKPTMCEECSLRLCDCIIRPCEHQFCNVCIRKFENVEADVRRSRQDWKCPRCNRDVQHVAGFSAPMNLPGEERLKVNVPVTVLKVLKDGRPEFQSIYTTRL